MTEGSEFDIIARYFKPLALADDGAFGLGDDAAILDVPNGQHLVVTSDALVGDVHFLRTQSPQDIAHKVVGVNLSDLAAMGAHPRAVFLAAQFPKDINEPWIADFASGLAESLAPSGAVLMGGDTVSTPGPLAFTLTALGFQSQKHVLTRAGANVGDALFVSGTIGDGALGLLSATGKLPEHEDLYQRYARPQPRLALGQALAERGLATACIDISDGLIADVGHICEQSNTSATLEYSSIPLSNSAQALVLEQPDLKDLIVGGGDDYELAFTVKAEHLATVFALGLELDVQVTRIGLVEAPGQGVRILDTEAKVMTVSSPGYHHF